MYSFIAILFILSKSVSTNENITQINKHVPLQFYFHLLIKKPPAQADKYMLIQLLALRKQHQSYLHIFPHILPFHPAHLIYKFIKEVIKMIDNQELPIGFTMELAQHSDILNQFAKLPEAKQNNIINGARDIASRNEMRNYVENMFQ